MTSAITVSQYLPNAIITLVLDYGDEKGFYDYLPTEIALSCFNTKLEAFYVHVNRLDEILQRISATFRLIYTPSSSPIADQDIWSIPIDEMAVRVNITS